MGYQLNFNAADVAPELVVQAPPKLEKAPNHVGEATPSAFRLSEAFVPKTPQEQRIIDVARRNEALMGLSPSSEAPPADAVKVPSHVVPAPPEAPSTMTAAMMMEEATKWAQLAERTRNITGGEVCTIPDRWFKGARLTLTAATVADKTQMDFLANRLRQLGAKVGFVIGESAVVSSKKPSSYATAAGNHRLNPDTIRRLKVPIVKAMLSGPKTIGEIMQVLADGNYDDNTYFKVNQMMHILGCKKSSVSNGATRGPSYIWSLPAEGAAE